MFVCLFVCFLSHSWTSSFNCAFSILIKTQYSKLFNLSYLFKYVMHSVPFLFLQLHVLPWCPPPPPPPPPTPTPLQYCFFSLALFCLFQSVTEYNCPFLEIGTLALMQISCCQPALQNLGNRFSPPHPLLPSIAAYAPSSFLPPSFLPCLPPEPRAANPDDKKGAEKPKGGRSLLKAPAHRLSLPGRQRPGCCYARANRRTAPHSAVLKITG